MKILKRIYQGVGVVLVVLAMSYLAYLTNEHERQREIERQQLLDSTSVIYEDGSGLNYEGDVFCLPSTHCTVAAGYVVPPSDAQERYDALMASD